jgi:CO/xanthine dehydrogenase FAD-binding subunit
MRAFAYDRASSEVTAIRAASMLAELPLVQGRAPVEYLAGGTTLIDLMKLDVMRPAKVVDLGALTGAHNAISASPDGLRLEAMVKMSAAADHPEIVKTYPVISQSLQLAASAQLSQHGDAWRQCAATDPLPVFPRYVLERMQQARSRFGLRRNGRNQSTACNPWW